MTLLLRLTRYGRLGRPIAILVQMRGARAPQQAQAPLAVAYAAEDLPQKSRHPETDYGPQQHDPESHGGKETEDPAESTPDRLKRVIQPAKQRPEPFRRHRRRGRRSQIELDRRIHAQRLIGVLETLGPAGRGMTSA